MLGRKITNPAVLIAKRHIQKHTNREGRITVDRLNKLNNWEAKQTALRELGYIAEYNTVSRLTGYYKP